MIGFCFLTYDEVERSDIWEEYLKDIPKEEYEIYCHPKFQDKILNQNLFKNKIIPEYVETQWGKFSLVEAQYLLLKEALKNKNLTHIIFVSHNTIPIQSFYKLRDFLKNYINQSIIEYRKASKFHIYRYDKLNNPFFSKEDFYFQSQWTTLCINDAVLIVNNFDKIKDVFKNSEIPDEHAFINFLIHSEKRQIVNHELSKMYWVNGRPKIFTKLRNDILDIMKKNNNYFLRKINPDTVVDIKHLLS